MCPSPRSIARSANSAVTSTRCTSWSSGWTRRSTRSTRRSTRVSGSLDAKFDRRFDEISGQVRRSPTATPRPIAGCPTCEPGGPGAFQGSRGAAPSPAPATSAPASPICRWRAVPSTDTTPTSARTQVPPHDPACQPNPKIASGPTLDRSHTATSPQVTTRAEQERSWCRPAIARGRRTRGARRTS